MTPDIEDDAVSGVVIETLGYNSKIVMSSHLFHDMMRDLAKTYLCEYKPDDKAVRVCCDGNRLVLVANGKLISSSFEVRRESSPMPQNAQIKGNFSYEPNTKDRWPVCERFAMSHLQKVAKAKNISSEITILMQPNYPIVFSYKSAIGVMSYIISPKDDDEWLANPELRVLPPESIEISGLNIQSDSEAGGSDKNDDDIDEAITVVRNRKRQRTEDEFDDE